MKEYENIIMVCCGIHCTENKSVEIKNKIEEELIKHNIKEKTLIFFNGCFGRCRVGPVVEIIDPYYFKTNYIQVQVEDVEELVLSHLIKHERVSRLLEEKK